MNGLNNQQPPIPQPLPSPSLGGTNNGQTPPQDENAENSKIYTFIQPVISLISLAGSSVYHFTAIVAGGTGRILTAAQTVFYRLIFPPRFNPVSDHFKGLLDAMETRAPQLMTEIDLMGSKFTTLRLISQDMSELRQLREAVVSDYDEIKSYVEALADRTERFPIQDRLDSVMDLFETVKQKMDGFCLNEGEKIIQKFKDACALFSKDRVPVLKEILVQVKATWDELEKIFEPCMNDNWLSHQTQAKKLYKVKEEVNGLITSIAEQKTLIASQSGLKPLLLSNIGNSCYMDSALQSLLCIDTIRDQLKEPLQRDINETDAVFQSRLTIQAEICRFIDEYAKETVEEKNLTLMEYFLALQEDGPSLYRLREAFFKSGLHFELDMAGLTHQHDAAYIFELLIDYLLKSCKYHSRAHAIAPKTFPGLYFRHGGPNGKSEENSILQVSVRKDNPTLDFHLKALLGQHPVHDAKDFDPKEGVEYQSGAFEKFKNASVTSVSDYRQTYRLTQLPPVLVVQFKRFNATFNPTTQKYQSWKVHDPIILPQDGIVDLTPYHLPQNGLSKTALYKIRSMVRHIGASINAGHYVSEVELGGKYFHCDDTKASNTEILSDPINSDPGKIDPKKMPKTARDKFYSITDPYILVMERLSDSEADIIIQSRSAPPVTPVKTSDDEGTNNKDSSKKESGGQPELK